MVNINKKFLNAQDYQQLRRGSAHRKAIKKASETRGSEVIFEKNGKTHTASLKRFIQDSNHVNFKNAQKAYVTLDVKGKTVLIPVGDLNKKEVIQDLKAHYGRTQKLGGPKHLRQAFQTKIKKFVHLAHQKPASKAFRVISPETSQRVKTSPHRAQFLKTLGNAAKYERPRLVFQDQEGKAHHIAAEKFFRDVDHFTDLIPEKNQVNVISFQVKGRKVTLDLGQIPTNNQKAVEYMRQKLDELQKKVAQTPAAKPLARITQYDNNLRFKDDLRSQTKALGINFRDLDKDALSYLEKHSALGQAIERQSLLLKPGETAVLNIRDRFEGKGPGVQTLKEFRASGYRNQGLEKGIIGEHFVVSRDAKTGQPFVFRGDAMGLSPALMSPLKVQQYVDRLKFSRRNNPIPPEADNGAMERLFEANHVDIDRLPGAVKADISHTEGLSQALLAATLAAESMLVYKNERGEYRELSVQDFIEHPDHYQDLPAEGFLSLKDDNGQSVVIDLKELAQNNVDMTRVTASDLKDALELLGVEMSEEMAVQFENRQNKLEELLQKTPQSDAEKQMLERFKPTQKPSFQYIENSPISKTYWQSRMQNLAKSVHHLGETDFKAQDAVYDIWREMRSISMDAKAGKMPLDKIDDMKRLYEQGLRTAQKSYEAEAAHYENLSEWYATGQKAAEFTRDAAANTVNAVADVVPAIKPIATGMNAALAFVDTVGSGGTYEMATVNASVQAILSNLPDQDGALETLKVALGKIITQSVLDVVQAVDRGETVDFDTFKNAFTAHLRDEVTSGVIGALTENPALVATLETMAGQIYDIFLSGD